MASNKLYFELYTNGSKTTNTFDVYLDSSSDAVENSYYYDSATYTPIKLTGTNGFSALTASSYPITAANICYRIRILYQGSLRFCSAWFKPSKNGYADYITYYGTNGPSNGLYRIAVAGAPDGLTSIVNGGANIITPIKKIIPCTVYLFWGGGYLSGGTRNPIVGMSTIDRLGETYYTIYVPSSEPTSATTNKIVCCFYQHNPTNPENPHSFFNSYGFEADSFCIKPKTGGKIVSNILFRPQEDVICTGQMAEAISPYAKEFANNGAMCLTLYKATNNGFYCSDSGSSYHLVRFESMAKRYSVIINTVFLTDGSVNSMFYRFSGDSKVFTTDTVSFSSGSKMSGLTWYAYIYNLLDTNYTNTDLNKRVSVSIGGYITTVANYWYYRVIGVDGTIIKNTTLLNSNATTFTTTMRYLDGAVVLFSRNAPSQSSWPSKKASDYNTITTHNETTTSLATIGEFDY